MEPFFDAGYIVFDSPAAEAERLGASAVLVVVLELSETEGVLKPAGVTYELEAEGVHVSGTVAASMLEREISDDERAVRLGSSAAARAIAEWKGM